MKSRLWVSVLICANKNPVVCWTDLFPVFFASVQNEKFPTFLTRLRVPPTTDWTLWNWGLLSHIRPCQFQHVMKRIQNMLLMCFLTSAPGSPGSPAEPGFPRSPSGPFGFKWQCVRCNNILNVANYNINAWHKNTDIYSRTIFTGVTSLALQEKHVP